MSSSSSLSDLFGEESSDDFIPPTSPEDSSDEIDSCPELPRKSKQKLSVLANNAKKRLRFNATQPTSSSLQNHVQAFVPQDTPQETAENGQDIIKNIASETKRVNNEEAGATPKKFRKTVAKPYGWKCNKLKRSHQSGKAYVSKRGKEVPQKTVKMLKNCEANCKYKCGEKISYQERCEIHSSYYSLPTSTEKRHFLINTTSRMLTARPKRKLQAENDEIVGEGVSSDDDGVQDINQINQNGNLSRRKFTFKYYLYSKGEKLQVCKPFYLGTLSISQKPIYTAHSTKNVETNTPAPDNRGTNKNSRRLPEGDPDVARQHIQSFPVVESHYCRSSTKRLFLGSHLSIGKMYSLYIEKCNVEKLKPVKKSMYYRIFVTEFNYSFHSPKSDRCDLCEKHKVSQQTDTLTEDIITDFERHQTLKTQMRETRKAEKEKNTLLVLIFDLENVILTPHANISSLFYYRKLNIYNLTAYYTPTKQVYCAIWSENLAGRAGNDIASAFSKILNVVSDENDFTNLITWSDSCVPQNRNSIISNAVLHFLQETPNVSSVTMKYSLPGHSCVQEIDSVHSMIEKAMNKTDFFSPIGLIRILKQISPRNPYRVIQMRPDDFKDFQTTSKLLNYKQIPYTQVACLTFSRPLHTVMYKTSHDKYEPVNCANIKFNETPTRQKNTNKGNHLSTLFDVIKTKPKVQKCAKGICALKAKDIKAAFPYMPLQDRDYYSAILKSD